MNPELSDIQTSQPACSRGLLLYEGTTTLLSVGVIGRLPCLPYTYVGPGDLNPNGHTDMASTLPTEPYRSPAFIFVFSLLHVELGIYMPQHVCDACGGGYTHGEIRKQLRESVLFLLCGFWGSNPSSQAFQWMPLLSEPFYPALPHLTYPCPENFQANPRQCYFT